MSGNVIEPKRRIHASTPKIGWTQTRTARSTLQRRTATPVGPGPPDRGEEPEDRTEDDEREQDVARRLREQVEQVSHDRAEDDL